MTTFAKISVVCVVVVFVADIVCKIVARSMLASGGRFAFSTPVGLIGFVPSHNDVLAFSLPIPNAVIWPVGWVIVLWILWKFVSGKSAIGNRQSAIMIVLGAISNLLDRTLRGGVTDYLSLTSLFPAFNLSDLLIIAGVIGWWVARERTTDYRPLTTDS